MSAVATSPSERPRSASNSAGVMALMAVGT